jgi:hypothetical protein
VYYPSLNTLVVGKTTTKLTAKADLGKETIRMNTPSTRGEVQTEQENK